MKPTEYEKEMRRMHRRELMFQIILPVGCLLLFVLYVLAWLVAQ